MGHAGPYKTLQDLTESYRTIHEQYEHEHTTYGYFNLKSNSRVANHTRNTLF